MIDDAIRTFSCALIIVMCARAELFSRALVIIGTYCDNSFMIRNEKKVRV